MKNQLKFLWAMLLLPFVFSCSKDNSNDGGSKPGVYPQNLTGTIYYKWATEGILKLTLPSAVGGSFIQDDTKLNSFDISRDGKYKLTAVNASTLGNYVVKFTLSNMSDGSIVNEFNYTSPAGNSYCTGKLSPDNSLIVVHSNDTKDDGITILKTNGEFIARLTDINGQPFGMHDTEQWLPNNELLITHGNNILRIPPPYNSGSLVKTMEYETWGPLAVNYQGTQLAMRIGNHISIMKIDGTDQKQITTSNFVESVPVFSPDGKYLLVGSHYRQSSIMGYSWDLKIIPNDGKQYNVDPVQENSAGVIPVFWKGKDRIEVGSGQVIWR